MTKQCICKICTCGQHKCPHRPWASGAKSDPLCKVTEYNNEYRKYSGAKREPFKPDNAYKASGQPMPSDTTNKVDYIKHPVNKIQQHQPEKYNQPEGEMDTMTSYAKDYIGKAGDRVAAIRQDGQRKEPATFEGNPTYKADYRTWDLNRVQPIKHDGGYVASVDPFGGSSTYVNDYQKNAGPQGPPRAPIRPDQAAFNSTEPFNDRTGYRADFVKHDMPQRFKKPKEEFQVNKNPLDSMTTNKRDYTAKDIAADKARSFKPEGQGYRSDAPFDGHTTQKGDYKPWEVKPVQKKGPDEWKQPQGEMDLNTNYNNEFTSKPQQRATAIKPASRKRIDAKFEGDSTYAGDFRKWPGSGRRGPIKAGQGDYAPSSAPFEGLSTYTGHYHQHAARPATSFKPDGLAYKSDAPFDGHTNYRTEFTPKEAAPCPAAILQSSRGSNMELQSEDIDGHKFYQQKPKTAGCIRTSAAVF